MNLEKSQLEHALQEVAGVYAAVEVNPEQVAVSGIVRTEGEHEAAMDIIREFAGDLTIVDNLIVESVVPAELGDLPVSETDIEGFAGAMPNTSDDERLEPGDFTDQDTLRDPLSSAGPSGTHPDDELDEGDRVFVPPVDPVRTPEGEFLGGFQETAEDDNEVPHSQVVPGPADEAITEAVVTELHQDAATANLDIEVVSEQGIVYLKGTVADLEDAENSQAVASRMPGVIEVRDLLEVAAG